MKKVLSFVLVLAMILGCTSMAFAVTFKDQAEVTNTEAVAVLNAVGVLEGDDAGNMRPTATLTRAEACAMIARLMLGSTAAKKLTATVAPFKDVAADNWAAGYIAFCASEGIVAGVGNDKFNPTGTLKVGEFGKMLLCVLGYDAKAEGLTGSDWANNTAKLMVAAGINVKEANSADCAREVAAQVALNALNATCVEYKDKATNITIGNATINVGGSAAEAVKWPEGVVDPINYDGSENARATTVQLAEKLYEGKLTLVSTGKNFYGQLVNTWKYTGNVDSAVGSFVSKTPVMTATTAIKGADLYAKLGEKATLVWASSTKTSANVTGAGFVNNGSYASNILVKTMKAEGKSIGGNGIITEIYRVSPTSDNYYVVQIVPRLAQVTAVVNYAETADKGAYTKYVLTDKETTGSVQYDLVKYSTVVDKYTDKTNFTYDGTLAKLDYVMIYGPDTKYVVNATTKVEGLLTGIANTSITIDGTKYSKAGVNGGFGTSATVKKTVVLDSYGYAKQELGAAPKYLFVFDYATGVSFVDPTTHKVSEADYMYAVLADGTFVEAKASGGAADTQDLYSYEVDAKTGLYTLTVATKVAVNTINQSAKLHSSVNVYADNSTKYYVAQYDADNHKYTGVVAYTGYANMPKLVANTITAYAMADKCASTGLAKYVFVDYQATNSADAKYVYFTGSKSVDTSNYTTYDVIVAGKEDTMKLTDDTVTAGLYNVANGAATEIEDGAGSTDGWYVTDGALYVTWNNGTLYKGEAADATTTYLSGVDATVPVYEFSATGVCTVKTVAELYQTSFKTLVLDVNAAGTAVEAIYLCK